MFTAYVPHLRKLLSMSWNVCDNKLLAYLSGEFRDYVCPAICIITNYRLC